MSNRITAVIQEAFGPWEPSTYRGPALSGTESWQHTVARYPYLKGWRGVTPEALLAARHHPDVNLRLWLNAILTAEEAEAEVGNRHEAGLGPRPTEHSLHADDDESDDEVAANPGWATAYD